MYIFFWLGGGGVAPIPVFKRVPLFATILPNLPSFHIFDHHPLPFSIFLNYFFPSEHERGGSTPPSTNI